MKKPAVKLMEITPNNIDTFQLMDNRRPIRKKHVYDMMEHIKKHFAFDSPIILNKKKNMYRVIDGNHRLEAIKKQFTYDEHEINCIVIEYDNLSNKEELDVFEQFNIGQRQSISDFLTLNWNEIQVIRKLQDKNVYITPKWSSGAIGLKSLTEWYILAKDTERNRFFLTTKDYIKQLKKLKDKDAERISIFYHCYVDEFGEPDKKIKWWKNPIIKPCIYFFEKNKVSKTKLKSILKRLSRKKIQISGNSTEEIMRMKKIIKKLFS